METGSNGGSFTGLIILIVVLLLSVSSAILRIQKGLSQKDDREQGKFGKSISRLNLVFSIPILIFAIIVFLVFLRSFFRLFIKGPIRALDVIPSSSFLCRRNYLA